jgi:hypothetical protein
MIQIAIRGHVCSGVADRFDDESWLSHLWSEPKQDQPGQIQLSALGEVHVLQEFRQGGAVLRHDLVERAAQEIPETEPIQLVDASAGRYLVRLQQIDILEQAAEFLFGLNASLVGTGFEPDHALTIEVRLIESLGDDDHDHGSLLGQRNILRAR